FRQDMAQRCSRSVAGGLEDHLDRPTDFPGTNADARWHGDDEKSGRGAVWDSGDSPPFATWAEPTPSMTRKGVCLVETCVHVTLAQAAPPCGMSVARSLEVFRAAQLLGFGSPKKDESSRHVLLWKHRPGPGGGGGPMGPTFQARPFRRR
ncbi:hypothetical protein E4U41_005063, partial [Claviceps citrina]